MPLFAVWSESALYIASKETAKKSRNLAADGRCVITTDAGDMHLIVEGEARRVRDEATLLKDLVGACDPQEMTVDLMQQVRGGLKIRTVVRHHREQ